MILPIGDAPNPRGFRPWVTWALLLINVAVYLLVTLPLGLQAPDPADPALGPYLAWLGEVVPPGTPPEALLGSVRAYDLVVFTHGYRPVAPEWADLLTAMFLHGGLLHLAGNMLFLWIYGDNVEHRLGRLAYLAAYLASGAAATLGYAAVAGGSGAPLIGASGAISGVLGFYFVLFPANHVRLLLVLPPFLVQTLLVSARLVLGAYVVLDNLVPFLFGGGGTGVAYGAHLGGFVAGALAAVVVSALGLGLGGRAPAAGEGASPGDLSAAIRRGDATAALAALARSRRADLAALEPDERVRLGAWLAEVGRPAAGLAMLRREASRPGGAGARAALQAGRVLLDQGQPAAAYRYLVRAARQRDDAAVAAVASELARDLVGR